MINKSCTQTIILCGVLFSGLPVIARVGPEAALPTTFIYPEPDYKWHFDPHFGIGGWDIPEGWVDESGNDFAVEEPFKDTVYDLGADWQWETEWYNPPSNLGFVLPLRIEPKGFGYGEDRFPLYVGIKMFPGKATFYPIRPFNESERYEWLEKRTGFFYKVRFSANEHGLPFRHDVSICELDQDRVGLFQENGDTEGWIPLTEEEVMSVPHVEITLAAPLRVPTLSLLGSIAMVLALLTVGAIGITSLKRRALT